MTKRPAQRTGEPLDADTARTLPHSGMCDLGRPAWVSGGRVGQCTCAAGLLRLIVGAR